jgi:hypothetical protein
MTGRGSCLHCGQALGPRVVEVAYVTEGRQAVTQARFCSVICLRTHARRVSTMLFNESAEQPEGQHDRAAIMAAHSSTAERATSPERTSGYERIVAECRALEALLVRKNAEYGDSALAPMRLFAHSDAVEQLACRIDDKLSRIRAAGPHDDDTTLDLAGYLLLYRIAQRLRESS